MLGLFDVVGRHIAVVPVLLLDTFQTGLVQQEFHLFVLHLVKG